MSQSQGSVFFVDDEPDIQEVVARTLEMAGMTVRTFGSAEACLEALPAGDCDLVISDVRLPGVDGITFLTELRHAYPWLPTIVVTGYGHVPMAVDALNSGVCDFLEKPLGRKRLLSAVEKALKRALPPAMRTAEAFTAAEAQVLRLVLQGKTSKEISRALHRSVRTIESHRSHIMHKMHARNLVELVLRAESLGLGPDWSNGLAETPGDELQAPS